MIEERYLETAVKIRRTYLKLVSNLDLYKSVAISLNSKLESSLEKIKTLEKQYKDQELDSTKALNSLNELINNVDKEGQRLENLVNPINTEIEGLMQEEQQLYRQIIEHHKEIPEHQIIQIVKDRLKSEGLID